MDKLLTEGVKNPPLLEMRNAISSHFSHILKKKDRKVQTFYLFPHLLISKKLISGENLHVYLEKYRMFSWGLLRAL